MFHYGLKPRGYLMLGSSETVGEASDLFTLLDRQHKIYVKQSSALRLHLPGVETNRARKTPPPSSRSHLQSIIKEQESTNQELRAANQEILSSNEEIQRTNEALQTAQEEIQATTTAAPRNCARPVTTSNIQDLSDQPLLNLPIESSFQPSGLPSSVSRFPLNTPPKSGRSRPEQRSAGV